jgi:glycosyltransferase involved in cell wall biosynthesis
VPIDEAREAFGRATVVALPYLAGFRSGVASIAFSLGRPVVTTRVGDTPADVQASGGGLVVPSRDPRALAAALLRLLRDRDQAAVMGRRGYEWVMAESSWDVVAERLEAAYLEALRRRRRPNAVP